MPLYAKRSKVTVTRVHNAPTQNALYLTIGWVLNWRNVAYTDC